MWPEVTQPEVDTTLGRVRGQQVGVKGTDRLVNVFLGIPFAKPPLGPGRFSAPRPAQSWEGVRDASTAPAMCLQDLERMDNSRFVLNGKHQHFPISEDCLILNIYSPAEATVMVWIHGGALVAGAATSHDGSALAAYGDVVVVTVQYRLGLLGFLSTGDEHAPGNWGFLDVVAALHWVQGNISPFGGDPNSVTIFGGSAGACIVSALSFADSVACSSTSSAEMLQCLREKANKEQILNMKLNTTATYTIDGTFFPKSPRELLRERQFHSVPFLLGVNNHEFGWLIPKGWGFLDKMGQMSVEDMLAILRPHLTILMGQGLMISKGQRHSLSQLCLTPQLQLLRSSCQMWKDIPPEVMRTIIDEHLGGSFDAEARRSAVQEFWADLMVIFPTLNFSRNLRGCTISQGRPSPIEEDHSFFSQGNMSSCALLLEPPNKLSERRNSGAPVFFYEFQHRPSSFAKIKPDWVRADHGAEIAFIFGGPFLMDESSLLAFPEATQEEKQLSLTMMAQWTQFARTGDPNGEGLPPWPTFKQLEQYLEISPTPRVGQKLKEAQMQFWAEILSANFRQWQQKQKGRKAQEEL
ncbi:carboxylesterase 3 [Prionailurus iriomotensis]